MDKSLVSQSETGKPRARTTNRKLKWGRMMGFYSLLGLILHHPAGCNGLTAMCLSVCVSLCSRDNGTTMFKCTRIAIIPNVCGGLPAFHCLSSQILVVICGGLQWFVVVYGRLWWFGVVCDGLRYDYDYNSVLSRFSKGQGAIWKGHI